MPRARASLATMPYVSWREGRTRRSAPAYAAARSGPVSAPARVTRSSRPASQRADHSAGRVRGVDRGAHQAPGPAQVGHESERRDEDVVALDRRDRADGQQPVAGGRALGERGLVGAGDDDVQPGGGQVVGRGEPVAGPAAGADDGVHRGQGAGLRRAARGRAGDGEADRQVHEGDQGEAVPLVRQRVRRRGADQAVDDDDGPVRQSRQHRREAAGRRLVQHHVVAARAEGAGQADVVDVPAARSRGVREADGPDEVHVHDITAPSRSWPRRRGTRAG